MTTPLRALLDRIPDAHAGDAAAIAAALREHAATLPADADGAEALRWAEHVFAGHLADAAGLQRFLMALPAGFGADEPAAGALARCRWVLHRLGSGGAAGEPVLADAPRWRALQNVVLALALQGRVPEATALLREPEAAAAEHAEADARKAYAACANNVAQHLRLGARGDAARDALMLEAAAIALRAWQRAGDWMNDERAEYELARCHAVLGRAADALRHAQRCHDICEAQGATADERFFAHEALLHAHLAAQDGDAAAAQRDRMQALLAAIDDPEMHAWCTQVLADLPPLASARAACP